MKRIFLLLDDYVELTFLETILKKVGFDAVGYQGVTNASDKALEILPDLLILSDIIKGTSTHEALFQIKKLRPQMKGLLLRRDFTMPLDHDLKLLDLTLKSPIEPLDFLKHVCRILQVETDSIADKFVKLGLFRGTESEKYVKVQGHSHMEADKSAYMQKATRAFVSQSKEKREARYETQLQNIPEPEVRGIDPKKALKEAQELRNRTNDSEIKKIDEQRQAFVKTLFKK